MIRKYKKTAKAASKRKKEYEPAALLFRHDAKLPPRFLAWFFSNGADGLKITSETIRDWRKNSLFGEDAQKAEGHFRISWQVLLKSIGACPHGNISEAMQRRPYASEVVAARIGKEHRGALELFRRSKIAGQFKMGAYWYARASDFDGANASAG